MAPKAQVSGAQRFLFRSKYDSSYATFTPTLAYLWYLVSTIISQTNNTRRKLRLSAFQRIGLGVADCLQKGWGCDFYGVWGVKYNCALFCEIETHNQFLRIFLHTGKLCLDVTSCDLLEFWLWQNVICWAPIVIFHTFGKCCVLRYYYYVGTGLWFFLLNGFSRLANFHHSEYSFPR